MSHYIFESSKLILVLATLLAFPLTFAFSFTLALLPLLLLLLLPLCLLLGLLLLLLLTLALLLLGQDFFEDFVVEVRGVIWGVRGEGEGEAAIFFFCFHGCMFRFRRPRSHLALKEALLLLGYGTYIELPYQISLLFFFGVVEDDCGDLEWIYVEVFEPLGVTRHVDPGVENGHDTGFLVKLLEHFDVVLKIITLILLYLNSWQHRNSASLPVVYASPLEVSIRSDFSKVSLKRLGRLARVLLVDII